MTKPNFENNEALNNLFEGFKTIDEVEKEKALQEEQINTPNVESTIENNNKTKKNDLKKESIKSTKKNQIYSEVDSVVCDYLNLKTIVMGKSKKDILNEIFEKEIKATFKLSDNASLDEMQKAIDKKMKQIEGMKNLFK